MTYRSRGRSTIEVVLVSQFFKIICVVTRTVFTHISRLHRYPLNFTAILSPIGLTFRILGLLFRDFSSRLYHGSVYR